MYYLQTIEHLYWISKEVISDTAKYTKNCSLNILP